MTTQLSLSTALRAGAADRAECAYQTFEALLPNEVRACDAVGAIFIATFGEGAAVALLQEHGCLEVESQAFHDAVCAKLAAVYPALGTTPDALLAAASVMLPAPMHFDADNPRPHSMIAALSLVNDEASMSFADIASALVKVGH